MSEKFEKCFEKWQAETLRLLRSEQVKRYEEEFFKFLRSQGFNDEQIKKAVSEIGVEIRGKMTNG